MDGRSLSTSISNTFLFYRHSSVNWNFIPRTEIPASQWDALVRTSPDGWVFGLYHWQEIILSVERWNLQDHSFGVFYGDKLMAVVPLQLNLASRVVSSSGWGGVGPMVTVGVDDSTRGKALGFALERAITLSRELGACSFDIISSPVTEISLRSKWGVNPLVFHGFEDESGISQVIDLRGDEESLWNSLTTNARRKIRQAQNAGVKVEAGDWSYDLDHYYELHCETYRRTGVEPHPKAYFSGIAEHLGPAKDSLLWKAVSSCGEVLAFHNSAVLNRGAFYHTGCSRDAATRNGANYLLFWLAVIGSKEHGVEWYDCGPIFPTTTDKKLAGLTTFKTKFGGETHRLFRSKIHFETAKLEDSLEDQYSSEAWFGKLITRVKNSLKYRLRKISDSIPTD
jgi:hypothetical protein